MDFELMGQMIQGKSNDQMTRGSLSLPFVFLASILEKGAWEKVLPTHPLLLLRSYFQHCDHVNVLSTQNDNNFTFGDYWIPIPWRAMHSSDLVACDI